MWPLSGAGLTAAVLLCQAGKRMLLLEARRLLTGVIGHTLSSEAIYQPSMMPK